MMTTISGIDVYRYQPNIDWQKVRDIPELRFVYAKATQGISWKDPLFESHRNGAIWAGKDFGALHFLDYANYVRGNEIVFGRQQAEHFWKTIESNPGQAPFICDTETNESAPGWGKFDIISVSRVLKISLAFHIRMKELSGRFGGDYTPMWATAYMKNFTEGFYFGPRYKLVKDASGKLVQPVIDHFLSWEELATYLKPIPTKYDKYTLFQYCSVMKGSVIGTNASYIDADIFNGSEEEYSVWMGKTCVPTSPVITEDDIPDVANEIVKRLRVISSVNVRNGIGTSSPQYFLNGSPFVILKNEPLDVYGSAVDNMGNPWHRIGYKEWVCEKYNGVPLLEKISQERTWQNP